MMRKRMNNKGAALVAVLIGVLFIAILASSMLYMSTMNYKMKSMRQKTSTNFYTAEFALSEMLSQVKQYCYAAEKPQDALKTLLNGGSGKFNRTNLQNLIHIDNSLVDGIDHIEVSSVYDGTSVATYSEASNYIYLKGVTVTAYTKGGAYGEYASSITTDIAFGFPPQAGPQGKLNDFSILSDSPMSVEASSQYIGGDLYLRANSGAGGYGTDAFRIGGTDSGEAVVTLMSRYAFLQGDLSVLKNGMLYISGNLIVDGNVKVEGTGQLICGGNMYIRGTISGTGKWAASGSGTIEQNYSGINWAFYDTNYPTGLANKLVAEKMYFHTAGGASSYHEYSQIDFRHQCGSDNNSNGKLQSGTVGGIGVNAIYLTNGVTHNFENTLIISPENSTAFHGSMLNSTYLNVCPDGKISIGEGGGTQPTCNSWGTMSDEAYEAAKKLLFYCDWSNNYSGVTPSFNTSGLDMTMIGQADGETDASKYLLSGSTALTMYKDGYFYKTAAENENYFAYGKFLNDNIADILGAFKAGATITPGADGKAQPTIIVSNWTKE